MSFGVALPLMLNPARIAGELTDKQREALQQMAAAPDGMASPWDFASTTVNVLRRRGYMEDVRDAAGYPAYRITAAGRAAIGLRQNPTSEAVTLFERALEWIDSENTRRWASEPHNAAIFVKIAQQSIDARGKPWLPQYRVAGFPIDTPDYFASFIMALAIGA